MLEFLYLALYKFKILWVYKSEKMRIEKMRTLFASGSLVKEGQCDPIHTTYRTVQYHHFSFAATACYHHLSASNRANAILPPLEISI